MSPRISLGGAGRPSLRALLIPAFLLSAVLPTATPTLATAQQDSTSALLQGVLLDERSHEPISLGVIHLVGADGQTVKKVESDGGGRFSLHTPGLGTFHVHVERLGYRTKESGEFSIPPGHVLTVEIRLTPAPQDTASAVIQGVLLDEEAGVPVSRGVVRLMSSTGPTVASVESDREGRFSLRTPGPGTFHLKVSGLGYQDKESGEFSLPGGHVLIVEIHLSPAPLSLDSMEVVGRRRPLRKTEQLLQGRLLDYETGIPIPQGTISLLKAHGSGVDQTDLVEQILSDDRGLFSLITPLPGTYRLKSERIGYRTTDSPQLHMMPGDTVLMDLYMSMEAILLDPITVRASARPWADRYSLLGMDSFFYRQSRFGDSGAGTFLTRDSIAGYEGRVDTARMLLETALEVRMVNQEGGVILAHGCNPRYYLDGVQIVRGDPVHQFMLGVTPSTPVSEGIDPEIVYPPETLEAVEIYVSPTIPGEFSQGYPCGVIALWTRRR